MANSFVKYIIVGGVSAGLLSMIVNTNAKVGEIHIPKSYLTENTPNTIVADTPKPTPNLPYPYKDESTGDPLNYPNGGGLKLDNPSNINSTVEYDPVSGNYIINQSMGAFDYRPPTIMDSENYQEYIYRKQLKSYWKQKVHAEGQNQQNSAVIPKLNVGGEIFDRIFGGNTVDIRPNGSAELIFAYNGTRTENPALPVRQRRIRTFDFNQKIQLNVIGKIGDKLKLTTSYNTEATFDFENQMKLEYTGYDDDIIKKIEAGNVSLPLNGSLITGSQTLFGVKTQLQFGRMTVTSILSQQKGKKSEVQVTGGAQVSKYEVQGDNYEQNKHFFLGQYFRDNYNASLANLPFVNSPINITRIEAWVTNINNSTIDVRDVVGFTELAEDATGIPADQSGYVHDLILTNTLPDNGQNDLYLNMNSPLMAGVRDITTAVNTINSNNLPLKQAINYEKLNARKLQASEYTVNTRLGFISLNQQLNPDQVLAVAYQYTANGQTFNVGEFSDGGISSPQALYLKLLKSTTPVPAYYSSISGQREPSKLWDLMMKNIYSIGSYQINPKDFRLDVIYTNVQTGTDINYLPVTNSETSIHGKPLVQVLNLDKLNLQNDKAPDGAFDFIDGVTINANTGRIIFSTIEPFGKDLRDKFIPTSLEANKYVFEQLYDSTKTAAQQFPNLNRFKLKGQYQSSSSSEISLGAPNVPQGSVIVTAGGVQLTENVDYTVDYTLGRVKIINEGILNSGMPIKISLESNALFAIQQKRLLGAHLDYRINKDFSIGGTILNLTERPLTQKVNIGDEPISNTIWGLDGNYRTDAPFLTRWIDKIPLLETKEMSTITAAGEFAYLVPGHSKAIGKNGNSYIDDFEGSQSTIDLRAQSTWRLASTPQGQPQMFPEGSLINNIGYGFNRALLNWYVLDPLFLRQTNNLTPSHITNADMSNNFTREVPEQEIFPNRPYANGQVTNIPTFDMAYYPSERGPYNYDTTATAFSEGLDANGNLKDPESRWGGVMRMINTNDFEAANIEFIQFWMMDPFNPDNTNPSSTGDLYFNIGNISEDVLSDSYRSSENGLPAPSTQSQNNGNNVPTDTTVWGKVPVVQPLVNAFNSDEADRPFQDVGLDGMDNTAEQSFFSKYLAKVQTIAPGGYSKIAGDPSADDFHYFRGTTFDNNKTKTLDRYKQFNGMEDNSRSTQQSPESYPTSATTLPDGEDINRDNNLSTNESYFQYHVSLKPGDLAQGAGFNYITNVYQTTGQNIKDGSSKPITWYQFRIPIRVPEQKIGTIEDFRSIRFIRMFMKGFDKPIVLRFARLELVRGEWRKYGFDILQPGLYIPNDDNSTLFNIAAVNIEENGSQSPVNYVLPPGIQREINAATANLIQLNEQAMALTVCNLEDGKARAAFKNTELDVRSYKKLKMFVHAEASTDPSKPLYNNDLQLFVRLGTDYTDNYYEYVIPLQVTPPGSYNNSNEDDQYKVWPQSNEMVIEFAKLQSAKIKRNNIIYNGGGNVSLTTEFVDYDGTRKIVVKGNPNLAALKTIMIGIINPKKSGPQDDDDGVAKCGTVWVNELRLTDFDEKGGWAANARVNAKLADFGNLALSGNIYTPGFGSIENKVSERKREELKQYDVSTSLELGKFIPEKANVHIPMFMGYSETFITPQFNPLDPDIILKDVMKDETIPRDTRDSIGKVAIDYTRRKSLNFTNVKKDKGANAKKSHIYDVENWAASYSFTEMYRRNINIEYNIIQSHRGGLQYNFAPRPKNIAPFSKTKIFQKKYLQIIKDINFYPYPNKFGFSTDVQRDYNAQKNRNITGGDLIILPTYNKLFNMNRNYTMNYDITKALKVDFTASNQARILEPLGEIDTQEKKDTIRENFLNLGKTTMYNHQTNVNYTIPINKLPLMDFTQATVRYAGTYSWQRAPFNADTLGNTIQNSRNISWNGQLNMTTLYNKVSFLKKINQKPNNKNTNSKNTGKNTSAISNKDKDKKTAADSTKKKDNPYEILEHVGRLIMSVKNVSVTYTDNAGTLLPGYAKGTQMMGMDEHWSGPSTGFIFGMQKDIRPMGEEKDWFVKNQLINNQFTQTSTKTLNFRANVEPFKDCKIELSANRAKSDNLSEFYRWNNDSGRYLHESPVNTGNFSMSFLAYKTSFKKGEDNFVAFLNARANISQRLGAENANSTGLIGGYAQGYNETSPDVLIAAFTSAYSGKNSASSDLNIFQSIPKPNWRATYDGLSKIEAIKKYFKSFTLSHSYRSTYSIGGFTSNLLYAEDANEDATALEQVSSISNNPNFIAQYQINTVTISEQWSPFIKLDMTLNNSLLISFEYKKDRNLSLGLTSKTITEIVGNEIVAGTGYRLRDIPLGKMKINNKQVKSDVNLKIDVSYRKNVTTMNRIVEKISNTTGGTDIISIKASADYVISSRINIRFFYDRIINKPVISTTFKTVNTNAGLSLRLTLSN